MGVHGLAKNLETGRKASRCTNALPLMIPRSWVRSPPALLENDLMRRILAKRQDAFGKLPLTRRIEMYRHSVAVINEVEVVEYKVNGSEADIDWSMLEHFRSVLLSKCRGLNEEHLKLRSVEPSSLSLLGLLRHMSEVEISWFARHQTHLRQSGTVNQLALDRGSHD
jgi:hypothetical protein